MKKKISVLLLFLLITLNYGIKVKASSNKYIVNILDLTLFEYNHYDDSYSMNTYIDVEEDKTYTIVVNSSFLGKYNAQKLTVDWGGSKETYDYFSAGGNYFYKIKSQSQEFKIVDIKFDGKNNALFMMYEGLPEEFISYRPYSPGNTIETGYVEVDYDRHFTKDDINSLVKAINPNTKEYVDIYIRQNNFKNELGQYKAIYEARLNGTTNIFDLDIIVKDLTGPEIITNVLEYNFSDKPNVEDILKDIQVVDNIDIRSDIKLNIVEENISKANYPGEYVISIEAIDKSNNKSVSDIRIRLVDKKAPEIIGPNAMFIYTSDKAIPENEIINKMIYKDDADADEDIIKEIIKNEYKETKTPGKYVVEIKATDKSGNHSIKTIIVHVINNELAEFVLDEKIKVTTSQKLTQSQVKKWFMEKAEIEKSQYEENGFDIDMNIYKLNYDKEGEYPIFVKYGENLEEQAIIMVEVKKNKNYKQLIILTSMALVIVSTIIIIIIKRK